MSLFKGKFRKESIRLKDWDYSQNGYYFVTICVKGKRKLLGEINGNKVRLSQVGKIVEKNWLEIPRHFNNVSLDEFIVMPDHLHGIIIIDRGFVETRYIASLRDCQGNRFGPLKTESLSLVIQTFKASVKRWCTKNGLRYFHWQPRFYEHIIRNERSLEYVQKYIHYNVFIDEYPDDNWKI